MKLQRMLISIAIMASSTAHAERYEFIEYLKGGSSIDKAGYSLKLPVQDGSFKAIEWRRFKDNENPKSTVVNIGLGNSYSWAGSITVKAAGDIGSADIYATKIYPEEKYSKYREQIQEHSCVKGGMFGEGQEGYSRFYEYVVLCVNSKSKLAYEILFSEKSLLGREPDANFHKAAEDFFNGFEWK